MQKAYHLWNNKTLEISNIFSHYYSLSEILQSKLIFEKLSICIYKLKHLHLKKTFQSILAWARRAVKMLNVVQMETVTRVTVCLISLAVHRIVDLNACRTQNARIIWLALIVIAEVLARTASAVWTHSALLLATPRSVNVWMATLAIHSISAVLKRLQYNSITLTHAIRARAAPMPSAMNRTAPVHVSVCPTISVIHTKAVDQNVHWTLIVPRIEHVFEINALTRARVCARKTQSAKW